VLYASSGEGFAAAARDAARATRDVLAAARREADLPRAPQ
jgi:hypothetical protein